MLLLEVELTPVVEMLRYESSRSPRPINSSTGFLAIALRRALRLCSFQLS